LRLAPAAEADLDFVLAVEADPEAAPFITHRVWLDVKPDNERRGAPTARPGSSRRASCGMHSATPDGRRESLVLMSMLAPEWRAGL
jgi:hypothetical protein